MPNHTYNVEAYNDIMQAELNKLWGIGALLLIVLIAMVVYMCAVIVIGLVFANIFKGAFQTLSTKSAINLSVVL